ncbi:MAG: hypothetical protein JWR60_862 [Polaromonas sp.]|nr:hypothetical protein [Polaromonas sp.]
MQQRWLLIPPPNPNPNPLERIHFDQQTPFKHETALWRRYILRCQL